ncbi:MAG: hypothetical protein KKF74_03525 [Nanoarchaeota archaeon]|nr:hypothetical protein [Nanoarchaeota archaeon]
MVHELTDEELLDKFESETNIVRTRADELLKLVKQRRELSFEDAAKALNVSVQTIESWANFLEEEKILSIKYNFTTPFITVFHEKIKAVPETGTLQKEIIEKKELNKAALLKEEELSEINRMLAEAYSCLKKGQFDKAKEIYAQIKKQYDDLPLQFLEKKKELNTTLTRLSKDLSLNLSKASLKEMEKKSQNIRKLLKMLEQKIEKREVLNAIKIYGQIKIIYNSLPEGFLEQKLILQNKIIEIYERLITIREEQDIMDTSVKKSEIINLLEELKQSMNEKNIPLAIKLYEKVRELYNSLPKGFLQEKAELQARIIRLYEELLSNYKLSAIKDIDHKTKKIDELSRLMKRNMAEINPESASEVYNQIKNIFYSMPEGFLKQKTDIQKNILGLYETLALELDKRASEDFNIKYQKINKMLEDAFNYVKNKNFEVASDIYKQLMMVYNSMPTGFLEKKTMLRIRIIAFYKDLSSHEELKEKLMRVPEVEESITNKKFVDIPLPSIEQFKPEKPVEAANIKKLRPLIQKPQLVMPNIKPKLKPLPFKPTFSPVPSHQKFTLKKIPPAPSPNVPLPKAAERPMKKQKSELFKKFFKKKREQELMPPTPPGLAAKK